MTKLKLYFEATAIVPKKRSGIGHTVLEILRELDKDEYTTRCSVVAFVPYGEGRVAEDMMFKNIKIRQLPFPHKILSLLSRISYGLPLDVFLGRGFYIFPNYRNFNLLFSKSITFIHDICYLTYPEFIQPNNLVYLRKNMHKWLKRTNRIIAISQNSKDEIVNKLNVEESMISVINLGVNPDIFYPRKQNEIDDIKEKYHIDKDFFLYIGNIEPRKNLSFLIKSFSANDNLKGYTLFLVGGDGWLNDTINTDIEEAVAKGYNIVRNKVYVPDDDIPVLMSGSMGVFLPSHHEGFGLSAVQAEACGTNAIVSNIPVLREIGGDRFVYFDNNQKSFNKAIFGIINKESGKAPHVNYTWQRTVSSLLKEINKMRKLDK